MENNFRTLREQWALKADITKDAIVTQQRVDQMANPHNEPYHNKRPRRETGEIVSDLSYQFADLVLKAQYGYEYETWLKANTEEKWGFRRMK